MKTLALVVLSVILSVSASPLGDRAVFRRHNGIPLSRRYILQSRQNAPAACSAVAPSNTATSPGVSSTDLPAIGGPSVANNSTTTVPSVASNSTTTVPSVASNSTITVPPVASNSTITVPPVASNSTTTVPPVASNSTTTVPSVASNSTTTVPSVASNSTTTAPSVASNTTVAPTTTGNSTTTTNSTATRRFWARDDSFSGDSSDFSSSSVETDFSEEITFEESISTYIQTWENLCFESGGDIYTDDPCRTYGSFYGIDALMEYADPCDQQDVADGMITFANSHGIKNRDALINFALGYRKHSRHSVEILGTIPSSLYCLTPPVNPELNGVCNEQPSGVNPGLYGSPNAPLVPFGSDGTCPLGMTADTSSCNCVSSGSSGTPADTAGSSLPTDASSTVTANSSLSTDTSTNSTSTNTAANAASNSSSTDTALASAATIASSTDTTVAAAATIASSTDTAVAAAATNAVVTPTNTGGVNFQPTGISGNVNDPAGRRR